MTTNSRATHMIWEIETQPSWHGYEWRVAPSPSVTNKPIEWGPWVGNFRFRSSAIRAARRYCRRMSSPAGPVWRDVERCKLPNHKVAV